MLRCFSVLDDARRVRYHDRDKTMMIGRLSTTVFIRRAGQGPPSGRMDLKNKTVEGLRFHFRLISRSVKTYYDA